LASGKALVRRELAESFAKDVVMQAERRGVTMFDRQLYKTVRMRSIGLIAAGTFIGNAAAQEPDAQALLDRMSAEIAALDSFILSGELYVDDVPA